MGAARAAFQRIPGFIAKAEKYASSPSIRRRETPEFRMTNPLASGLKTTPAVPPGVGLNSAANAAETSKALPNWNRAAVKTEPESSDGRPALKAGLGPRPGGLDGAPVMPQSSDESKKPQMRKPVGSRLAPAAIANAARGAVNQNLLNNKWRVFLHPKTSVAMAIYGFFSNLIKGKGKSE